VANFNLNKVIIGGRLTDTPVLKTTPSGIPVTTFTVAVNRRFGGKNGEEAQADFFNVTAWRQTAEFIVKFFRKASSICVVGSLQTRTWTDQNGQKRYATEIVADEAYFVDAKGESAAPVNQSAAPVYGGYMPDGYTAAPAPKFEELADDDELPF
jgi:single-strand DNA-binding protein